MDIPAKITKSKTSTVRVSNLFYNFFILLKRIVEGQNKADQSLRAYFFLLGQRQKVRRTNFCLSSGH